MRDTLTPTASGKSLVYMSGAVNLLMNDSNAKVLALYPARALIQDQKGKWEAFTKFGVSIGYIDGRVGVDRREFILKKNNIILMTPDVGHAWLLRQVGNKVISAFLDNLKLLILDEAHVYEGAFGTNMAYFLRRLEAVTSSKYRIVASSATMGKPESFMQALTGRSVKCFSETDDGAHKAQSHLILARGGNLTNISEALIAFASQNKSPFLAFADSRKQVEQIVAITRRSEKKDIESSDKTDSKGLERKF